VPNLIIQRNYEEGIERNEWLPEVGGNERLRRAERKTPTTTHLLIYLQDFQRQPLGRHASGLAKLISSHSPRDWKPAERAGNSPDKVWLGRDTSLIVIMLPGAELDSPQFSKSNDVISLLPLNYEMTVHRFATFTSPFSFDSFFGDSDYIHENRCSREVMFLSPHSKAFVSCRQMWRSPLRLTPSRDLSS
jgi:hypothetical protein